MLLRLPLPLAPGVGPLQPHYCKTHSANRGLTGRAARWCRPPDPMTPQHAAPLFTKHGGPFRACQAVQSIDNVQACVRRGASTGE